MDIFKELQDMVDRSFAFVKRNEIELRGNGRESSNVYIVPEIVASQNELGEYIYYEKSHKVTVQEPKESKKERGQRATAAPYDDAIDESFYFPLGRS